MKVLWFTNVPLPAAIKHAGLNSEGMGGHWMAALAEALRNYHEVQLAVTTAFPGVQDSNFTEEKVHYYLIGQPHRFQSFSLRAEDLLKAAASIRDFQPDIIHVHGTERFYGLMKARGLTKVPEVVSLQGILGPYSIYTNYFGALSPRQVLSSTRIMELFMGLGLIWGYREIRKAANREFEICQHADAFLGRTRWDAAWASSFNPEAKYFHVGEILRGEFMKSRWDLAQVDRHTIIFTNAGHPRRGTEVLIDAVKILKREFPDVRLRLAGKISQRSGYGKFLRNYIYNSGLEHSVSLLGYLDAAQMASELSRAHVFAIASYIENSPNSLAEAMMVGMPCVASYVGGIPDMIENGQTGLLFPAGDATLLAASVRNIFQDDRLASRLGTEAMRVAERRHCPDVAVSQLLTAYRQVLMTIHEQ